MICVRALENDLKPSEHGEAFTTQIRNRIYDRKAAKADPQEDKILHDGAIADHPATESSLQAHR